MNYLKSFKIFESSSFYATWDDVKEYINNICDTFEVIEFKNRSLTIPNGYNGTLTYTWSNMTFDETVRNMTFDETVLQMDFRFENKFFHNNSENILKSLRWMGSKIEDISDNGILTSGEIGEFYSNTKDLDKIYKFEFSRVREIGTAPERKEGDVTVIPTFTIKTSNLIEDIIRKYPENKEEIKEEIKKIPVNIFISKLFQSYCRYHSVMDFTMLEVYRSEKSKILDPIDSDDISLPHNLDRQFIFDVAPLFWEKVYLNSGLMFRLTYGNHYEYRITRSDNRLNRTCPKDEIEQMISKYGVGGYWNEVFVKK